MTDSELREIEGRLAAAEEAAPGPWRSERGSIHYDRPDAARGSQITLVAETFRATDCGAITPLLAGAKADLRSLLDEVKALRDILGDLCNDDDRMHAARELGRREGWKGGVAESGREVKKALQAEIGVRAEADVGPQAWAATVAVEAALRYVASRIAALPDEAPPAAEGGAP